MIKKSSIFLICIALITFGMCGCKDESEKKLENTTSVVIGYGSNSYAALISDKDQIKKLEDLFNGAEFTKTDTEIQQPYLSIAFNGEKISTSYYIDEKDVIKTGNGIYSKSKQINFEDLYSIFKQYLSKKK